MKRKKQPADFHVKQNKNFTLTNRQLFFYLSGIIVFALLAYSNSFFNEFNTRDDNIYVTENPLLRDLSWTGLSKIFTELYYNGHLPLTILSFAFDYHFWKLDVFGYHLTNFLLHALNVLLVYFFTKEISGKENVSLLTALLFAIHPMGVQSVSWISERKNLLYAVFFLLSLIQYTRYVKTQNTRMLAAAFFFFICSIASKWSAYPLPFVLVLIDWYFGRKLSWKLITEKVLFLAAPFISVLLHLGSGVDLPERFSFAHRVFFGSYSFLFYVIKSVLPINLSTIYGYPKVSGNQLPEIFYWSLPAAFALVSLIIYRMKKYSLFRKEIVFSFLFFVINIGMVLQVLKFIGGSELVADRYGYISFVGIFFLLSEVIFFLREKFFSHKKILTVVVAIYIVCLGSYTYCRNTAWKNTITLYTDAIQKNDYLAIAYANRANYYYSIKKQTEALTDYNECIKKFPFYDECFYRRGLLYFENGLYEKAKPDFDSAVARDPNEKTQYNYLGLIEMNTGKYEKSIPYFRKALSLDSTFALAYNNIGWAYSQINQKDQAEAFYNMALHFNDSLTLAYLNRGWLFVEKNLFEQAIHDFNSAEKSDPENAMIYNNRGYAFFNLNQYGEALRDFNKAIEINPQLNFAFYNRALIFFELNDIESACSDLKKAAKLGHGYAAELAKEKCSL